MLILPLRRHSPWVQVADASTRARRYALHSTSTSARPRRALVDSTIGARSAGLPTPPAHCLLVRTRSTRRAGPSSTRSKRQATTGGARRGASDYLCPGLRRLPRHRQSQTMRRQFCVHASSRVSQSLGRIAANSRVSLSLVAASSRVSQSLGRRTHALSPISVAIQSLTDDRQSYRRT